MNIRNTFITVFLFIAVSLGVILSGANALALAQVQFRNVDNLPVDTVSTLSVTGTGLAPNVNVIFLQCTGGNLSTYGEICAVAGCGYPQSGYLPFIYATDSLGNFSAQVPVSYSYLQDYGDIYGTCINSANPLRYCTLQLLYHGGQRANELIATTNLNFGDTPVPPAGPATKADCMGLKWQSFTFKNQGECIGHIVRSSNSYR